VKLKEQEARINESSTRSSSRRQVPMKPCSDKAGKRHPVRSLQSEINRLNEEIRSLARSTWRHWRNWKTARERRPISTRSSPI